MPRATTMKTCHRLHGRRSSRWGMFVSNVRASSRIRLSPSCKRAAHGAGRQRCNDERAPARPLLATKAWSWYETLVRRPYRRRPLAQRLLRRPLVSHACDVFSRLRAVCAVERCPVGPDLRAHFRPTCYCSRSVERSEEHTSELQSQFHLVCRLLLEKKKKK